MSKVVIRILNSDVFSPICFYSFLVRARITGTQNIAKITKSMKMVSAAKLRGDSLRLKLADPFSVRYNHFLYSICFLEFLWSLSLGNI
jgi:hypothetical protein